MSVLIITGLVVFAVSVGGYALMVSLFAIGMRRSEQRRESVIARAAPVRVTVLKPLAGLEEELAENLETFAALDWPDYEIVFGVARIEDPAARVAEAFIARHPNLHARLIITRPVNVGGTSEEPDNPKVAQLVSMVPHATGDVLVVSDANVRVRPLYLRTLLGVLAEPDVGLVTNLIAGTGGQSFGARLENLQLTAYIAPALLGGWMLSGKAISIGKSMAMRRADLERVGGFEIVANVLAEDHVLGQIFNANGLRVAICPEPIENRNVRCSAKRMFERHGRWAKMRRSITTWGFVFEPFLWPMITATVVTATAPLSYGFDLLAVAAMLHLLGACIASKWMRGHLISLAEASVEVIRPFALFTCWLRAIFSKRVKWRGHTFEIRPGSTLAPPRPRVWVRVRDRLSQSFVSKPT